jgi:hypothetical protein
MAKVGGTNVKPTGGTQQVQPQQTLPPSPAVGSYTKNPKANG